MKKLLLVLVVMIMSIMMAGCEAIPEIVEIDKVVVETEIVEIEIPVIVIEREIVEIEIPQIIVETEIVEIIREVEVFIDVTEESRTLFYTADTDLAILVVSRGEESYTIEFKYVDPLIGDPYVEIVQIEKQINGVTEDWFFMSDYSDYIEDNFREYITSEDDFVREVESWRDNVVWGEFVAFYEVMYNDYYDVVTAMEVSQVAEFDVVYESSLADYYDTDVYQLDLTVGMQIEVTVITTSDIDVNGYDNTLVWYDFFDYTIFTTTETTYTFDCASGGTYYFEVEQFNEGVVTYSIVFSDGNSGI